MADDYLEAVERLLRAGRRILELQGKDWVECAVALKELEDSLKPLEEAHMLDPMSPAADESSEDSGSGQPPS